MDGEEAVSSTRVRQAIAAGEMERARQLLGRRYFLDFPVEHGKALGRRLQFPTINQPIPPQMVLPRFGVYATMAQVDGKTYAGVTNIGVRPTVEKRDGTAGANVSDWIFRRLIWERNSGHFFIFSKTGTEI